MPEIRRFALAPSLILLGVISAVATLLALVLAVLGFVVAAVITLLISTQILLLAAIYMIIGNYRRQEKRARTWGVRHSTALQQIAWSVSTQRLELQSQQAQTTDPALLARLDAVDATTAQIRADLDELTTEHRAQAAARITDERRRAFHNIFKDRV